MEVFIKSIGIGAEYEGYIPYYYIAGRLNSGKIISIFDDKKFDLQKYINVNCLIGGLSPEFIDLDVNPEIDDSYPTILKGQYLEKYKIPSYFKEFENDISCAIQDKDGIILLDEYDLKDYKIQDREVIALDVSRYDLLDWHPLE